MSSWARDQESAGRKRHDQNARGRGTDVHFISAIQPDPPLPPGGSTSEQSWVWIILFLLQRSLCAGYSSGRLISLLRLQSLQQALQWETLAEMETSLVFVTGRTCRQHWNESRATDEVGASLGDRRKQRPGASPLLPGCEYRLLNSTVTNGMLDARTLDSFVLANNTPAQTVCKPIGYLLLLLIVVSRLSSLHACILVTDHNVCIYVSTL